MAFIGPDSCCGLQKSYLKQTINKWENKGKVSRWQNRPEQKQANALLSGALRLAKMVLSFNEGDLGLLAESLAGAQL